MTDPIFLSCCKDVSLRYSDPEDRIFNRVISDISVVLREITLTISDSIETRSSIESEIVRVVSLRTTGITRFKNRYSGYEYLNFMFPGLAATTNTLKTRQNDPEVFRDDDHRAPRQKRDESNDTYSTDNLDSTDHVASSIHLEPHNKTDIPDWFQTMKDQKWYGAEFYFNRTLYRRDPDRRKCNSILFSYSTAFECNTTSDWLNHTV